jgi:3-oxoacyl-[acyl-carrier protein] reductase
MSMAELFDDAAKQTLLKRIPLGRFGQSSEVADAVNFLIGNEYANNCVLGLDGGLSAVL